MDKVQMEELTSQNSNHAFSLHACTLLTTFHSTVALKISGTFKNVKVKNVPGHAISVQNPSALLITGGLFA
jgi:hypothetical protein